MKKIILFTIISTFPMLSYASGVSSGNLVMGFVWRSIVFLVFAFILYKLLKEPILNALDKRTDDIKTAINEAIKAKEDAQRELAEYKSKLSAMNKELEDMKERAIKAVEAEKNRILNEADQTVKKLKDFAESLIESDVIRAKAELKRYSFELAKNTALQKIESSLDTNKHETIINNYINKIGDLH
ncbi:MAG: ATP synthase F0 subunit B [Calditerrivibrio sp.]|nr:ATP synthase F0 subunit B [Calditerrivibrio sp.]